MNDALMNFMILTPEQIEQALLDNLNNNNPIQFTLRNASREMQQEYSKLNKLANKVPRLKDINKYTYMLEEYYKRVTNYHLMTKKEVYGTLDDLLIE